MHMPVTAEPSAWCKHQHSHTRVTKRALPEDRGDRAVTDAARQAKGWMDALVFPSSVW